MIKTSLYTTILITLILLFKPTILHAQEATCCEGNFNTCTPAEKLTCTPQLVGHCCGTFYPSCGSNLVCDQVVGVGPCGNNTLTVCRAVTPLDPSFNLPGYGTNDIPTFRFGANLGLIGVGFVINSAIKYVFIFAGLLLFFYLIYGALTMLSGLGNPEKLSAGNQIITRALTGFTIIFISYWLTQILEIIFDLNIL